MDITHLIVAIVALGIGLMIGQSRNRKDANAIFGSAQSPPQNSDLEQEKGAGGMSLGMRLFSSVFLFGWLIAWTVGILMAVSTFGSAGGTASLFMIGWLIAAIAGWVWAVYTLWKLVTGRPVKMRGWN
ncbi:hypothetical protein [Ruegeria atlantica]|uniref:hypothetical protein n=1 Tax=Ruegeria atlantica TaxID=81569 RepID=UPI00147F5D94|nr:hypothetical protein [Ruegeria atlantica]